MVTIGDVFSVIAGILAICASAWALMLVMTLLFTHRSEAACRDIETRPWKAFFIGLAILVFLGTLSLALLGNPIPAIKLAGMVLMLALLSIASVGAGGLSLLIGRRMQPLDPSLSAYKAVGRGAAIVVVASLLPFVGWWVFMPIVLAVSLGSGVTALMARVPSRLESVA
jgi:hypothetical protein